MKLKWTITAVWSYICFAGIVYAQAPAATRPFELWAFRSVLDGTPRILTIALHHDLQVGYDTYYCGIAKIWRDGVLKQGPVYNQKHGPQPVTKGMKYLDQPLKAPAFWVLGGKNRAADFRPAQVQFRGYRFEKGKIALRYEFKLDSLISAELEEWPEFIDGISGPKLERYFVWTQKPPAEYSVFADIQATALAHPQNSIQTNGEWKVLNRNEKLSLSKPIWQLNGLLKLAPQTPTYFTILIDPAAAL